MTPLPRGTCPDCGRTVAIRKGGQTREHAAPLGVDHLNVDFGKCIGSGKSAKERSA